MVCATVWALLALAHGYDYDFDILNYHFYNGFALVHGRSFVNLQPAMLQSYLYPLLDAVFYVLAHNLAPMTVVAVIAAWQSLAFPLLYRTGIHVLPPGSVFGGRVAVALLVLLGAIAPMSIWEAGSPRGDTITAVFVLAALFLVARGAARGALRPGHAALAGALVGAATAFKLVNGAFALGVFASLLVAFPWYRGQAARRAWFTAAVAFAAAAAAAFGVVYGPWAWALMRHLGNPVFPFYNQVFHSPYAVASAYSDPVFALPTWRDKLRLLFVRNSVFAPLDPAGLYDPRMAVTVPLCALALLSAPFREPAASVEQQRLRAAALTLPAFVLVGFVAWLMTFPANRYLSAVDMVAPLACVVALRALWPSPTAATALFGALLIALPLCAYHTEQMYWLPDEHLHDNKHGYFGVRFDQPPGIEHAAVAMLSDQPTAFVIPFFPASTMFARLQGSLLYWNHDFTALNAASPPAARRLVFGNAMGAAICRQLDAAGNAVFLLRLHGLDTPQDAVAMQYFGVADAGGPCTEIANKAAMKLELCPARRLPQPECRGQ